MKKIGLLLSIVIMGIVRASAQEVDSLPLTPTNESIETLSAKVEKLENDYKLLKFNNIILEEICSLEDLENDLLISYNTITISCFHNRYEEDLYVVWRDYYDECIINFNEHQRTVENVKMILSNDMFISRFNEAERDLLNLKCQKLEIILSQVKSAMNLYEIALENYKRL